MAVAFAVWTGAFPAAAQTPRVLEPLVPIREVYHEAAVPASGSLIRGVMLGSLDREVDLAALRVEIPETVSSPQLRLCVELLSIDGRLELQAEFPAPTASPGPYRLHLESSHREKLAGLSARELAALAHLAEDCRERPREILPVRWDDAGSRDGVFLVNALGGDAQLLAGAQRSVCRPSPAAARLAYYLECPWQAPAAGGPLRMTLAVFDFQQLEAQETVTVWWPRSP